MKERISNLPANPRYCAWKKKVEEIISLEIFLLSADMIAI